MARKKHRLRSLKLTLSIMVVATSFLLARESWAQDGKYVPLANDCHQQWDQDQDRSGGEVLESEWDMIKKAIKNRNDIYNNFSLNDDGTVSIFNPSLLLKVRNRGPYSNSSSKKNFLFSESMNEDRLCQIFFSRSLAMTGNGRKKVSSFIPETYDFAQLIRFMGNGRADLVSTINARAVSRIDCKLHDFPRNFSKRYEKLIYNDDDTITIVEPRFKYHRNMLRFSSEADPDAVCRNYGPFTYAGEVATTKSVLWGNKTVSLDGEGRISDVHNDREIPAMKEIRCRSSK